MNMKQKKDHLLRKTSYNKNVLVCVTSVCDSHVYVYARERGYKRQEKENHKNERSPVGARVTTFENQS